MIAKGARVNAENKAGNSLQLKIFCLLMKGETPLHKATFNNVCHSLMAELLLDNGAAINAKVIKSFIELFIE